MISFNSERLQNPFSTCAALNIHLVDWAKVKQSFRPMHSILLDSYGYVYNLVVKVLSEKFQPV